MFKLLIAIAALTTISSSVLEAGDDQILAVRPEIVDAVNNAKTTWTSLVKT